MESPVFNYYRRKIWKIDDCHRLALSLPPCIDAINKTAFYSKATRGPQLWLEQWLQKHGRPNSSPKMEPKCLYRPLLSGRSTGHKPRLLNASGWELGGKNMRVVNYKSFAKCVVSQLDTSLRGFLTGLLIQGLTCLVFILDPNVTIFVSSRGVLSSSDLPNAMWLLSVLLVVYIGYMSI